MVRPGAFYLNQSIVIELLIRRIRAWQHRCMLANTFPEFLTRFEVRHQLSGHRDPIPGFRIPANSWPSVVKGKAAKPANLDALSLQ